MDGTLERKNKLLSIGYQKVWKKVRLKSRYNVCVWGGGGGGGVCVFVWCVYVCVVRVCSVGCSFSEGRPSSVAYS